ncbi:hypothetical protein LCGC14_0686110 [marine sediment metagenome]|uniref:Uncharacterized protein n=1 Tax=marine sediment metagenome TaxID=412755 RepID=A0A0F9TUU8_9ZZZZ
MPKPHSGISDPKILARRIAAAHRGKRGAVNYLSQELSDQTDYGRSVAIQRLSGSRLKVDKNNNPTIGREIVGHPRTGIRR